MNCWLEKGRGDLWFEKELIRRVDREFYICFQYKKFRYLREFYFMEMIYYFCKYNCIYYLIIVCLRILQFLILRVKGIKFIFGGLFNYVYFCKYVF